MKLSNECVNETETAATNFLANCLLQCFTLLPSLAVVSLLHICHSSQLKEKSIFQLERTDKTDKRAKGERFRQFDKICVSIYFLRKL